MTPSAFSPPNQPTAGPPVPSTSPNEPDSRRPSCAPRSPRWSKARNADPRKATQAATDQVATTKDRLTAVKNEHGAAEVVERSIRPRTATGPNRSPPSNRRVSTESHGEASAPGARMDDTPEERRRAAHPDDRCSPQRPACRWDSGCAATWPRSAIATRMKQDLPQPGPRWWVVWTSVLALGSLAAAAIISREPIDLSSASSPRCYGSLAGRRRL